MRTRCCLLHVDIVGVVVVVVAVAIVVVIVDDDVVVLVVDVDVDVAVITWAGTSRQWLRTPAVAFLMLLLLLVGLRVHATADLGVLLHSRGCFPCHCSPPASASQGFWGLSSFVAFFFLFFSFLGFFLFVII